MERGKCLWDLPTGNFVSVHNLWGHRETKHRRLLQPTPRFLVLFFFSFFLYFKKPMASAEISRRVIREGWTVGSERATAGCTGERRLGQKGRAPESQRNQEFSWNERGNAIFSWEVEKLRSLNVFPIIEKARVIPKVTVN